MGRRFWPRTQPQAPRVTHIPRNGQPLKQPADLPLGGLRIKNTATTTVLTYNICASTAPTHPPRRPENKMQLAGPAPGPCVESRPSKVRLSHFPFPQGREEKRTIKRRKRGRGRGRTRRRAGGRGCQGLPGAVRGQARPGPPGALTGKTFALLPFPLPSPFSFSFFPFPKWQGSCGAAALAGKKCNRTGSAGVFKHGPNAPPRSPLRPPIPPPTRRRKRRTTVRSGWGLRGS